MYQNIIDFLTDERLLANLIALHAIMGVVLLVSVLARRVLTDGSAWFVRWSGQEWLDDVSREATRKGRAVIFWITLGAMALILFGGLGYHSFGYDIRSDFGSWYHHLTADQLLRIGLAAGKLVGLAVAVRIAVRLLRIGRNHLQKRVEDWLFAPASHVGADNQELQEVLGRQHHTIRHWFFLFEKFLLSTIVLTGVWMAGHVVGLGAPSDLIVTFVLRMLAILMIARLLTLGCRTLSHLLENVGNRHLGDGAFRRYWLRVTRLFPFAETCFEAAVYISAASLIIRELQFIREVANYGPRVVSCIGVFFITRVIIELLNVLLTEAFGLHDENRQADQKGQTLVPLLQSFSQYALYFGSALAMMTVLGIPTAPLLASVSIVGLAIGLGAQSLVTDVVSGFFILFENQFLVGDVVTIGDASGRVEAINIRSTQIRDESGKLHILPNGQIKSVINFSKGYVNAIVDITVPTSMSVDAITREMMEAGRRLKQTRREVLGETVVKGLINLTPGDMTIRAMTKVMPGAHGTMQNEYRRLLKQVFDERDGSARAAA